MTATETNPAGLREHDLQAIADLPEWHALTDAMNALIEAIQKHERDIGGQAGWLAAVRNHAAALAFADRCQDCDLATPDDEPLREPVAPSVVRIERGWVTGGYRCPKGHVWRCGYALAFPALIP